MEVEFSGWRDWQKQALANLKRFNVLVLHRRAGKTVLAILWLIIQVLQCDKPRPRGYYVASTYAQAKRIVWDYLKHYGGMIPGVKFNEAELRADFPNGARIQLLGAEPSSIDHIRGVYSDALVLDETADLSSRLWTEILRPTLADRKGRLVAIGTPKGRGNLFHQFYTRSDEMADWYSLLLTCDDTQELDHDEVQAMRQEMSPAEFQQELYCSFNAAIAGAFYAEQLHAIRDKGQVTAVPYDDILPVVTAWDIGIADATAIWFAQFSPGGEIRLIDYLEVNNLPLPDIIKLVKEKPYVYGQHIGPHDLHVREFGSGRTRYDIALSLGLQFDTAPNQGISDGIAAVRTIISRMWFDAEKTERGLECLIHYHQEYDDQKQTFKEKPLHDWSSHAADAMRYLATASIMTTSEPLDYSKMDAAYGRF